MAEARRRRRGRLLDLDHVAGPASSAGPSSAAMAAKACSPSWSGAKRWLKSAEARSGRTFARSRDPPSAHTAWSDSWYSQPSSTGRRSANPAAAQHRAKAVERVLAHPRVGDVGGGAPHRDDEPHHTLATRLHGSPGRLEQQRGVPGEQVGARRVHGGSSPEYRRSTSSQA